MISRIHAKLLRISANGETKIKLVDNKSTNGLIVNGIKVEEAILKYVAYLLFVKLV
jgi:pSer/pThr/pTyr-binding forkhead associated (FHA) protein